MTTISSKLRKGLVEAVKPKEASRELIGILDGTAREWRSVNGLVKHVRPPVTGWTQVAASGALFSPLTNDEGIPIGRSCSGTSSDTMRMEYLEAPSILNWSQDGAWPSVPFMHSTDGHIGIGVYDPGVEEGILLKMQNGAIGRYHWVESTGVLTQQVAPEDVHGVGALPLKFRVSILDIASSKFLVLGLSTVGEGSPATYASIGSIFDITAGHSMTDPRFCWFFQQGSSSGTNRFATLWDLADAVAL